MISKSSILTYRFITGKKLIKRQLNPCHLLAYVSLTIRLDRLFCSGIRIMSKSLVEVYNPVKGCKEWEMVSEHYDYIQEIARSGYGDMLHDYERNEKYELGIKACIHELRSQGRAVHVLDIGTGTGLLAMMAVRAGADSVTACEAFQPMQHCCEKVLEANGLREKVKLVRKRSTDMSEADLACGRASLLVTEVFDTELIGEGAVGTFRHALEHLLQPDCFVVPSRARVYAQPVCSPWLSRWNQLQPPAGLSVPKSHNSCRGSPALHDMQLEQLAPSHRNPASTPITVFRFDFTKLEAVAVNETRTFEFEPLVDGECSAVLMWWDLDMDPAGDILLSCAPSWAHPDKPQWRDHWMQAVYHIPSTLVSKDGPTALLHATHDEYSLWFSVEQSNKRGPYTDLAFCNCGLHAVISNTRYFSMNDQQKLNVQHKVSEGMKNEVVLYIGDCSWLPVLCARAGAKKVFCLTPDPIQARPLKTLIDCNGFRDSVVIINKPAEALKAEDFCDLTITRVVSEPYSSAALLPWHPISFMYSARTLQPLISADVALTPYKVSIYALPMNFQHLWKLRAPLRNCRGFNLRDFDNLLLGACKETDPTPEPQPLWEYPGTALATPTCLLSIEYQDIQKNSKLRRTGCISVAAAGDWNGVALWSEFQFSEELYIGTGPVQSVCPGEHVSWFPGCRQAVYFPYNRPTLNVDEKIVFTVDFSAESGELNFDFSRSCKKVHQ